MINMPERYEINQEIKLKNLILKEFKPIEKKKIKEYIKSGQDINNIAVLYRST